MSASTSCRERAAALLGSARRGELPAPAEIRGIGETCPGEFFRDVIEPLADSFESDQAAAYERIMRAWIPEEPAAAPIIPSRVDRVYVLSRVTLGADIKIVSPILAAMETRFPEARIVFVANRKSAELFEAAPRIEHLRADYPRAGPVSARLEFARELRSRLAAENAIVIDPDSRITQLGLAPVGRTDRNFHFPSRTIGGEGGENLTDLVRGWLRRTFGADGGAWIAPRPEPIPREGGSAAVSLGVGENEAKRVRGDFETRLLDALGERFRRIHVDRGVGGEEARRVTAAVNASRVVDRVAYWERGFAGFASIVSQCDLYAGYDSAGQHAAAAAGVRTISIFAGAPSERFRQRWRAAGSGNISTIVADDLTADEALKRVVTEITRYPLE